MFITEIKISTKSCEPNLYIANFRSNFFHQHIFVEKKGDGLRFKAVCGGSRRESLMITLGGEPPPHHVAVWIDSTFASKNTNIGVTHHSQPQQKIQQI